MANISIDIGGILHQLGLLAVQLKDDRLAAKEKNKAAQLLVYRALSLHPSLDHMRPPTGVLADVDWYTELRSPLSFGIFRKLGQNEHFKRTSLLGEQGARARIMLLLLWVVGHRLSEDQIGKLISAAVGDGLSRQGTTQGPTVEPEIVQLNSIKRVLVSLRNMIKTKLPLPPDRSPFQGADYCAEDEDKPLPRSELWGYDLPAEMQYEYDIRRNPALLLRPLEDRVIIPQTKLTLLTIQWVSCNFGLGKKAHSLEEIDRSAFWNADPPLADDDEHDDRFSIASWDSQPEGNSIWDVYSGLLDKPYEDIWEDEPIENFVHARFCSVYPIHGWAHRSTVRVLLFTAFSGSQVLPTYSQVLAAVHIVNELSRQLPSDVWHYAQQFIIARSLLDWSDNTESTSWKATFSKWTPTERSMAVVFADALKWYDNHADFRVHYPLVTSLGEFRGLLAAPRESCPDASDILSLPLLTRENSRLDFANQLPDLNPHTCICGECIKIQGKLPLSLEFFHQQYFTITSARTNGCDALMNTWEPALVAAEKWVDQLIARVECHFALLPWSEERRTGPAVLETANTMNVQVGSQMDEKHLVRFMVALSILTDDYLPFAPRPFGPTGIGYVAALPWALDREEYCLDELDGGPDRVMFLVGGWLYDLLAIEGVTVLHERENFRIVYNTTMPTKVSAVCMPSARPDFPALLPPQHTVEFSSTSVSSLSSGMTPEGDIDEPKSTIVLSNLLSDGFPLLSVSSPEFSAPQGSLAALIRVELLDRVIETLWKPAVAVGTPCEHQALWRQMTYCSPTANYLIQCTPPTSQGDGSESDSTLSKELSISRGLSSHGQHRLRTKLDELSSRLEPLKQASSPLERNRACIVRCGANHGPVDAMIILSASLHKKVYILDHRECWDCALGRMREHSCTVGIAIDTKNVSVCDWCQH